MSSGTCDILIGNFGGIGGGVGGGGGGGWSSSGVSIQLLTESGIVYVYQLECCYYS